MSSLPPLIPKDRVVHQDLSLMIVEVCIFGLLVSGICAELEGEMIPERPNYYTYKNWRQREVCA